MTTDIEKPLYRKNIDDLLSNYEEGTEIFSMATDWDHVPHIKPESVGKAIPKTWLGLAEAVIGIIARDKYGLKTYPNVIKIIDSKQMLSAYASVGMPVSYDHWSFGKELLSSERDYARGKMGLAYEIVINSDPSIAYCMAQNSKTMQLLVIAHASFGHNSFFRNNHLFRQHTNAKEIIGDLEELQSYVRVCEERYGVERVELLLDAAHALQSHGVNRRNKPPHRTPEEEKARRDRIQEAFDQMANPLLDRTAGRGKSPKQKFAEMAASKYEDLHEEENLIDVVASLAPHMQPWERKLLKMISAKSQYFYPQKQTQLMNEGWATFWHHTLMNDLYDEGLISDGMMLEFMQSHTGVVAQPDFESKYFSGINPYALGFAMFKDIQRICQKPTEEDRKWFPDIAGQADWVSVLKEACENYKDESFVSQYLSPKVIRDFRLISLEDHHKKDHYAITAIHNDAGYREIRQDLSAQYDLSQREPCIEATSFFYKHDRTLILRHQVVKERPLHEENAKRVLQYMHLLWGHPVVLESVSPDGELIGMMGCPKISRQIDKGKITPIKVPALVI